MLVFNECELTTLETNYGTSNDDKLGTTMAVISALNIGPKTFPAVGVDSIKWCETPSLLALDFVPTFKGMRSGMFQE